jgi:hypothetical protein
MKLVRSIAQFSVDTFEKLNQLEGNELPQFPPQDVVSIRTAKKSRARTLGRGHQFSNV